MSDWLSLPSSSGLSDGSSNPVAVALSLFSAVVSGMALVAGPTNVVDVTCIVVVVDKIAPG